MQIPEDNLHQLFGLDFSVSMKNKINELIHNNLRQTSDRLNLTFNTYTDILQQIYIDDKLIENMNLLNEGSSEHSAAAYSEISDSIKNLVSAKNGIRSITIIGESGFSVVYDSETSSVIENIWRDYDDLRKTDVYKNTLGERDVIFTPTQYFENDGVDSDTYLFHLSKTLNDLRAPAKGSIGVAVLSINESVVADVCSMDRGRTDIMSSFNFIYDTEGQIVSYPDTNYIGGNIFQKGDDSKGTLNVDSVTDFIWQTQFFRGRKFAVTQLHDERFGLIINNVYDRDLMFSDITRITIITVLVTIFLGLMATIVIRYTVKRISKSINTIVTGIKDVQKGNLGVELQVEDHDEIYDIALHFNYMTRDLKLLLQEIEIAVNLQKEAEIRALEAQINPHFLHNTLDSINWLAIDHGEYEISNMLRDLGYILRYSINKSNKIVTVQEEIDWLEKYISLQQIRFEDSFVCEINADSNVGKIKVHKLLLQPFVENAILHGFQGFEQGGKLEIDIFKAGDFLNITFADNGHGMTEELVSKFNDRKWVVSNSGQSIGMQNALSRMVMYYKEKANWQIKSIPQKGTLITVCLPAKEMG